MASLEEARRELARRELARRKDQPSASSDMLSSFGSGIRSGVEGLASVAGDLNKFGGQGASWLAEKVGASPETASGIGNAVSRMSVFAGMPQNKQVAQQADVLIGDALKHEPQTTAGKYARTVGEFVPAAIAGPGGLVRRAVTQAVLPGLGSEAGGQMTEGTAAEPYGRIVGAVAGGLSPSVARRAISPLPISPERQGMVQALNREGVDLTAGQSSGRKSLQYAESELGGSAGANLAERQGEQFTAAVLQRAGINANRATPEVIDGAFSRIGQQFDDLAGRNRLVADPQLVTDLRSTINEYGSLVPQAARAPVVENITNDIVGTIRQHGGIPGDSYQALRSRLEKMARSAGSDPQLSQALRGLRTSLDDAMERSIRATNPDDAGAWQAARNQYRNLLVIETAAAGAGENAALGIISPSQLRNATVRQGRRAYARGQGDFAELSRAGEAIMKPLPQSGTAPRQAARALGTSIPSALGAVAGSGAGVPGAMFGAMAGAAVPYVAGRALLSGPVRSYLGNQMAGNMATPDPRLVAAIAAMLANKQTAIAPPSP